MSKETALKRQYLAQLEKDVDALGHTLDDTYVCNHLRCPRARGLRRPCMFFDDDLERMELVLKVPTKCRAKDYNGIIIIDKARDVLEDVVSNW